MAVRRSLAVLLLAGLAVLLGSTPAGAADTGMLRLAHLSPDTPSVDVYVDSVSSPDTGIVLTGVGYGTVSDYQSVPAGTYTVSMRSAGAPTTSAPVLSTTVTVAPGTAFTVAGVGTFAQLGLKVLDDDLTPPADGQARARVVNASQMLTPASVALVGGESLSADLAFPDLTDYVSVPGGSTTLQIAGASGSPTDLPVDLASGSSYTVLLLDGGSGVQVQTVLDAASPGVVPTGGVEAGGGGTAGSTVPLALGGVALVALVGSGLAAGRRLPRRGAVARHAAR
ncbi:protein of unknown function [Klenkia soli]|uniref:DUF4397 domain-containing protein n=1 Tax=Klenkia soli TaxID=1052260 RepID=A0A1H0HR68_9ACTN|nr:DUF4397 domain-containing protein [Klenkia soli]SDO21628.1 protein of unknown function [Klenkia soli]